MSLQSIVLIGGLAAGAVFALATFAAALLLDHFERRRAARNSDGDRP